MIRRTSRRLVPALLLVVASTAPSACGKPVPASAPLVESATREGPSARQDSTRALESGEGQEEKSIEKADAGQPDEGDDDDDSTRAAPGSSTAVRECTGLPGGPPLDCNRLPKGSSTCMGQVIARRACETVGPSLDPKVAGAWMSCMLERTDKAAQCETSRIFDCGLKAIANACVDGSQRATCTEIAKSCSEFAPEITTLVCERALGAWKPERRQSLLECFHRGCDVGDFGACLP